MIRIGVIAAASRRRQRIIAVLETEAHRAWRILIKNSRANNNALNLREIEFRSVAGIPETASGGTVLTHNGITNGSVVFDGDTSAGIASSAQIDFNNRFTWAAIGYDFGTPKAVAEVAIFQTTNDGAHPGNFDIEYSDDLVTWHVAASVAQKDTAWVPSDTFARLSANPTYVKPDPEPFTVLYLSGTGSEGVKPSFDDSVSQKALTWVGNAKVTTAQFFSGSSCLSFDGTGDYIQLDGSSDWAFGGDPFTIEAMVRFNAIGSATFVSRFNSTTNSAAWFFGYVNGSGLQFMHYGSNGTTAATATAPWTPVTGVWYKVAVDKGRDDIVRLYINDKLVRLSVPGSFTTTDSVYGGDATLPVRIGSRQHTTPMELNGWLDEVRICKGIALYADKPHVSTTRVAAEIMNTPLTPRLRTTRSAVEIMRTL